MSPATASQGFAARHYDFGRGVVGGVAERARDKPRWLGLSDNLVGRPHGAMGSVRGGYREIQQSGFSDEPTSLAKLVPGSGASNRLVVHTKDGASPGAGKLFSVQPGVNGRTQLTPPFAISDADCEPRQINGALFIPQQGGTNPPLMYHVDGGVYRLDTTILRPPTGFTPGTALVAYTGGVDVGRHWWRLRYRYRNGTSKATAAFPAGGLDVTGTNEKVRLSNLLGDATALAQQDWIGWTLERTTLATIAAGLYTGTLGADALPDSRAQWFWVADGTGTPHDDIFKDADLFYRIDDGIYGDPPHMDGVVPYRNRLIGWSGSTLYVSQAVGDEFGTGPCNFDAELAYAIGSDGDTIQAVVPQGDRLLIVKSRSFHPFEGLDPEDFRTYELPDTGGAVGPRAVTVHGTDVYALGETGLARVRGNRAEPWGEIEVGHYLKDMNQAAGIRAKVKAFTVAGEYISFAYPSANSDHNNEEIVYDLQVREFRHFTGRRIRDAVIQEDNSSDFDGATLLTLDPILTAPPTDLTSLNPTFVTWADTRATPEQTYIQKVSSLGVEQWADEGVVVGANVSGSIADRHDLCPTNDGGVIVLVTENRGAGNGLYAQRFDSAGNKLWNGASGFEVVAPLGSTYPYGVRACSDGSTGAFIVWQQDGTGSDQLHRLTHIDGAGSVTAGWPIVLNTNPNYGRAARPIFDPLTGDVFVAYLIDLPPGGSGADLFVQRVSSAGVIAWAAGGVSLGKDTSAALYGQGPVFALDGAGGVVVVLANSTLVVKRVNAAGAIAWATGNLAPTSSATYKTGASDGAGGIIVVWYAADLSTRAQRVTSAGTILWPTPTTLQTALAQIGDWEHCSVSDGAGGIIAVWTGGPTVNHDIYAQRVNGSGGAMWGGGTAITVVSAADVQEKPGVSTDGANGAVVYWQDGRGVSTDVFGQRLGAADGLPLWTANGAQFTTLTAAQSSVRMVFTGTPGADAPAAGASVHRIWANPSGQRDEVLADGTGGRKIPTRAVTPYLDGGRPDVVKHITRLQLDAEGGDVDISATFIIDPGDGSGERLVSAPLVIKSEGTIVGDESGAIGPTDGQVANEDGSASGITGLDVVAGESTLRPFVGLGNGVYGTRYAMDVRADTDGDYQLNGFTLDGALMPKRDFS